MPLTVEVLTLTTTCECTFSLYYRILIQGGKTHLLIFIVGTNNFIEYLQSYQILIFIYYKFYFIIFIIIQYTVYVVGSIYSLPILHYQEGKEENGKDRSNFLGQHRVKKGNYFYLLFTIIFLTRREVEQRH